MTISSNKINIIGMVIVLILFNSCKLFQGFTVNSVENKSNNLMNKYSTYSLVLDTCIIKKNSTFCYSNGMLTDLSTKFLFKRYLIFYDSLKIQGIYIKNTDSTMWPVKIIDTVW